jgi:histidinol phosphatase-like PHP family hydrolase
MKFDIDEYNKTYDNLVVDGLTIRKGMEYGITLWNYNQFTEDLKLRDFDFVIGSVHFAEGKDPYFPEFWEGRSVKESFRKYLEETLKCVEIHDKYDVLGHLTYASKSKSNPTGEELKYSDFADITDEILNDTSYTFLLVSHQLDKADDSSIDLINELYDYSLKHGYVFYALTSSSDEEITWWMERTGAEYPFAIMDDTTLKTIIRSNPGVVLLKDGVVINKWNTNDLPDEYQLTDKMENLSIGQLRELSSGYQIMLVFAWFILPLAIVCMIDRLWERYVRKKFIDLNK